MRSYKTLFEVNFFHLYYDEFRSSDFEISMLPATRDILSGYSLLFRSTATGFIVLYNEEKKHLLESVKDKLTFSFGVRSINPHFETFTNIHPINKRVRYFFDNENAISNDNLNQIQLHQASFVDANHLSPFAYLQTNVKQVIAPAEIVVEKDGQICFDGVLNGVENFGSLAHGELGWYDILHKDQDQKNRYYLLPDSFERSFAVIDISFGGSSSVGFAQLVGSKYQLTFENRSILWTYYFVSGTGRYFEKVEIFSGKEKLLFSDPVKTTLANGQVATKVTSLISFPLQQRFGGKQVHAELMEKTIDLQSGELKLRMNLSTPDASRIKGMRVGEKEVYFSEIFVYV